MVEPDAIVAVAACEKTFIDKKGRKTQAIDHVSFEVGVGEFLSVLGPSGCGKSTLLRCMAGLERADAGTIRVGESLVDGVPPPDLAVVFQDYSRSLFPWMSVRHNVGQSVRKLPRDQREDRVLHALDLVGLTEFGEHYPWQLSGGMQQRVAIARALAARPTILIMDEPFASVDAFTRIQLEDMVASLTTDLGLTVIFVTHDVEEAIYLGDRVLVLSTRPARIEREFVVELARPRDQISTKATENFTALRTEALNVLFARPTGQASAARALRGSSNS